MRTITQLLISALVVFMASTIYISSSHAEENQDFDLCYVNHSTGEIVCTKKQVVTVRAAHKE